jgi:hypothetical protein
MSDSDKRLEQMLKDFEQAHPDAGKALRKLIDETPALKNNLLESIEKGNLERIEALPPDTPKGISGFYARKDGVAPGGAEVKENSIYLSLTMLEDAGDSAKKANSARLIVTHESEHALSKQEKLKADQDFEDKLTAIAKGPPPHDYTNALKEKGDSDRLHEATDQLAGFNAVAAHVFKQNPGATEQQLYKKLFDSSPEMEAYFEASDDPPRAKSTYSIKPGLTLGADGQLAKTPENIEAMAKYFYDARGYPQEYGLRNLNLAIRAEMKEQAEATAKDPSYKPPEARVNLKQLELEGFPLPKGVVDTSPPPFIRGTEPATAPGPATSPASGPPPSPPQALPRGSHDHDLSSVSRPTGYASLDGLLEALKDPNPVRMNEALAQFSKYPDIQLIRQEGVAQYLQAEAQKIQETPRTQSAPTTTQEAPIHEAASRKVAAM